uniref:Secreted protein n=1 Tax=Rhipicephalus zambeziensis TaxID=60191 RepID=A0A224YFK7_9ACAR
MTSWFLFFFSLTKFNLLQPSTAKRPVQHNSFLTDKSKGTSYCCDEIKCAQWKKRNCRTVLISQCCSQNKKMAVANNIGTIITENSLELCLFTPLVIFQIPEAIKIGQPKCPQFSSMHIPRIPRGEHELSIPVCT